MSLVFKCTYRGDSRPIADVRAAGGFVPKYLLMDHAGGVEGFYACKNKKPGVFGCKCANMDPASLYSRAREKFKEVLANPSLLNEHVMYNKLGYLATALDKSDMYKLGDDDKGAHSYAITSFFDPAFKASDALAKLGVGKETVKAIQNHEIFYADHQVDGFCYLAMAPKVLSGAVELTYFTPVPAVAITAL